jgi:carboxyl-terminal processing protease
MKKLLLLLAIAVFAFGFTGGHKYIPVFGQADSLQMLAPQREHPQEAVFITQFLAGYHYQKVEFDDSLSSVVFSNFFESLDPSRAYFLKDEVTPFEKYRYSLDDALTEGDLTFGYEVFNQFRRNATRRMKLVYKLLETEMDFTQDEYYDLDRESYTWPATKAEQDEIWRKIIKNQAITYKLAGKEWTEIQTLLTTRYKRVERAIYQYTSEDAFQLYMNALTSAFDPHTDYFSPIASQNFQIDMSLSLEGIGARLTQQLDYTMVAEIIPGGPASKSKRILKDDKIIAVAQGDDGEFVDVIGWRLDEVVQKIRGPKGSVVRLVILKHSDGPNAKPDTLRLVRDKIKLEEQAAKAEIIPIKEGNKTYKLGVITIPSFYINFDERAKGVKDFKSTTRDVKNLIADLQKQGMDGLLIDLRYNGGGSLDEAIDLTGLFIPDGPVVQVRDMRNKIDVHRDMDGGVMLYDGPLAVLNNRFSASASEIFSGAIQDYKRGVILGENSYGKGTVQNLIDIGPQMMDQLNRMISIYQRSGDTKQASDLMELRTYLRSGQVNLGQLKMTLAKFYRVTGSSTQRVGVSPDVSFPSYFDVNEVGESGKANALVWDEIAKTAFKPTNHISQETINQLNALFRRHLNEDPDLKKLVRDIEEARARRNENRVSLNLEKRRGDASQPDPNDLEGELPDGDFLNVSGTERLAKDPYLKESLRLLAELSRKKAG